MKKQSSNKKSNAFVRASMFVFRCLIIYPSYFLYKGFSSIGKGLKSSISTSDNGKVIDPDIFNSDIDVQGMNDIASSNASESQLIDTVENSSNGNLDFSTDVSNKLTNKISGVSKKVSQKKINSQKIEMAKQLIDEMKEKEEEEKQHEKKYNWRYEAMSQDGKTVRGYFEAYNKMDVINFLTDEGLIVYRVKKESLTINFGGKGRKIKNKDLIFIITQLSTYLKSGIALSDAIGILVRQTKNKYQKKVFYNVKYELMLGESLSAAFQHQGRAFPMILINMVRSAELTGELPEVLDDMANYFTEIEETRKQMISALTYPTLVLVFTVFVIIFVMLYVVPKFVEIYDSMEDAKIPAFTQAIVDISLFLEKNILFILIGMSVILAIVLYLYKKVKVCRRGMQYVAMKMPVIGNIIIYNEVAVFSKTFSSLLKHNVFITDSMSVLNQITNNEIYHDMILQTITNLSKGDKISTAFKDHWAFPIPAYEMIVTGEMTGQLAEMMEKVSTYYQNLHRNSVTRIKALIEPIVIILLTFGVGAVLLAVVIPMFNMYSSVQQMEA